MPVEARAVARLSPRRRPPEPAPSPARALPVSGLSRTRTTTWSGCPSRPGAASLWP